MARPHTAFGGYFRNYLSGKRKLIPRDRLVTSEVQCSGLRHRNKHQIEVGESTLISEATFLIKEVLGIGRRRRRRPDKAHGVPVLYDSMTAVELGVDVQIAGKAFGQVEQKKQWASCGCCEARQLYPQPEAEEDVVEGERECR